MESFIEQVRSFPCLWNPQHPDYREMVVRDMAWEHVVSKCKNTSITDTKTARAEWKRLRDNHREALKRAKLGQNKLLPAHITTWKYAKAMQFLEPFMKYRITEDIEMESVHVTKQSEHDVSTTETIELAPRDINERQSKRRCPEYPSAPQTHQPEHSYSSDALESFFECVLKSTREMPPWMQTQVKKKIFAAVIEAEEQLAMQDLPQNLHFTIETKIKTEAPDDT